MRQPAPSVPIISGRPPCRPISFTRLGKATAAPWANFLLERFGAPAETYEVGRPGPDLATEVQLGQVVRAMEWRLPEGILRLSLPRRLDGRLKIEVALANSFPPLRATDWGLDLID